MRKYCMIDFETLSTMPNAAALSLGGVNFTADGLLDEEFYVNIDGEDCIGYGLHVMASTVKWWADQSAEARAALEVDKKPLLVAMTLFNDWVKKTKAEIVMGNGADFDNPILRSCFNALDADPPFAAYNGRCYRTLKSLPQAPKMAKRHGTHHNALDDARSQACHMIDIHNYYKNEFGVLLLE